MYIIFGIIAALTAYLIFVFNKLISQQNKVSEAWSGIDVQLKRRYDLIPNIVNVVRSYSQYEQETFTKVVEHRSNAEKSNSIGQRSELEGEISKDIKKIFALAEDYPDLKASQNFLDLQASLTEVEDQLQYARRYYNGTIRDFNTIVQSVPSNIIASIFNFKIKDFFEIELATERNNPNIKL